MRTDGTVGVPHGGRRKTVRGGCLLALFALVQACASGAPAAEDQLAASEGDGGQIEGGTPSTNGPTGSDGPADSPGVSPAGPGDGPPGTGDGDGDDGSGGNPSMDASTSDEPMDAGAGDPDREPDAGGGEDACADGIKNGFETGNDCGGPDCGPCDDGEGCIDPEDCTSGVCGDGFLCAAPACDDGVKNAAESDVDCGGDGCDGCAPGGACADDGDCALGPCQDDNTCGCTPLTTADCGGSFCGSLDDLCGGQVDCDCQSPAVCHQDMCCTPETDASCGSDACGTHDDGCGGSYDCGGCGAGDSCQGGTCQCDVSQCTNDCGFLATRCCTSDGDCGCDGLLGGCN